jgi:hypothetical protein
MSIMINIYNVDCYLETLKRFFNTNVSYKILSKAAPSLGIERRQLTPMLALGLRP